MIGDFYLLARLIGDGVPVRRAWGVAGFPNVSEEEMIELKKVFENGTKTS